MRLFAVVAVLAIAPLLCQGLRGQRDDVRLRHSASPNGTIRIPLAIDHQMLVGQISLGVDKKEFSVVFDTGSGNLIVPSAACTQENREGCSGHQGFDASAEKAVDLDKGGLMSMIRFLDADVEGALLQTNVCLGQDFCVPNGQLLVAESLPADFRSYAFDGVLGLGMPLLAFGRNFNLVDMLFNSRRIKSRIFALYSGSSDGGRKPEATFGFYDDSFIAEGESLNWFIADGSQGAWVVQLSDVSLGSDSLTCDNCAAVIDSGCGNIAAPKQVVDDLHAKLGKLDCWSLSSLPKLQISLASHLSSDAGVTFDLSPADYVEVSKQDQSVCRVAISPLDGDKPQIILGRTFLQRYFAVFDQFRGQIGLARAK